jgi:hypothetical protein
MFEVAKCRSQCWNGKSRANRRSLSLRIPQDRAGEPWNIRRDRRCLTLERLICPFSATSAVASPLERVAVSSVPAGMSCRSDSTPDAVRDRNLPRDMLSRDSRSCNSFRSFSVRGSSLGKSGRRAMRRDSSGFVFCPPIAGRPKWLSHREPLLWGRAALSARRGVLFSASIGRAEGAP